MAYATSVITLCSLVTTANAEIVLEEIHNDSAEVFEELAHSITLGYDGGYIFPDGYAGEYFNDDGDLIIMVSDSAIDDFRYLTEKYTDVSLETVEYSRNELQEIADEYAESFKDYYCYYVDPNINRVVFTTDEETCKVMNEMVQSDDLPITFKTDTALDLGLTIRASKILTNSTKGISVSSGAGATDSNGNKYIITCGHGMSVGDTIKFEGNVIGKVSYVKFANNGSGDLSVIKLNSGMGISSLVAFNDGTEYIESVGDLTFSTGIGYLQGGVSGYAPFAVSQVNVTFTYKIDDKIYTIKNLTVGELNPAYYDCGIPGDSGSPIYYYNKNGDFTFGGIYAGHYYDGSTELIGFTPWSLIPKTYTIYTI